LVVLNLTVPKKVTSRQEELLRELGRIEDEGGEQAGFFDKIRKMFA
jgi:hypothetical protein